MPTRAIITTPYPTMEETAKFYDVPPERVAELMRLADEIFADNRTRTSTKKSRTANQRVAKTSRSKKK
jgi:hypothetical protein